MRGDAHQRMAESVELLAPALLREYLHRKGCRATLAQFDLEQPRTPSTISSRALMAERLGLQSAPRPSDPTTFLEALIAARLAALSVPTPHTGLVAGPSSPCEPAGTVVRVVTPPERPNGDELDQQGLKDAAQTGILTSLAPTAEPSRESSDGASSSEDPGMSSRSPDQTAVVAAIPCLVAERIHLIPRAGGGPPPGAPLGCVVGRRALGFLFGDRTRRSAWLAQGLYFNPDVPYGLVQNEGGPCGALAALQAHVLKTLYYDGGAATRPMDEALTTGVGSLLMTIAAAVNPLQPSILLATAPPSAFKAAGVEWDEVIVRPYPSAATAAAAVRDRLPLFAAPKGPGLLLLLLSALLTKAGDAETPDWGRLTADMDAPDRPLVVEHGYSSQELVNLLLHGVACGHVFDGDVRLPGEGDQGMLLRGVPARSRLGYLTLFEHFGSCAVGRHLKAPVHPCWVVCSESHFTVLFAKPPVSIDGPSPFDLWYYDQLGMQDAEIRLTVDPTGSLAPTVPPDSDLVPPLDHVIRTKWPEATVQWNDTDPIL